MTRPPEPLILVMALLNLLFFTIQATHYHQSFVHRDKPRTSVLEGHRRSSNTILENKLLAPALGKLVLFYSNSCHDCLSFASTLHKLSHQLNNWRQVLAIYKVDCEESVKVCHDFQIQHLPTLRFFHSNFERDRDGIGIGIEIRSRNIRGITTKIATLLASNSYKGVLHHKPVFKTLQSQETLKSLFHKDNVSRYLVLVFQPRHSQIGVNTLLDMLPHHEVTVRIVENPQLFANFGLQPFAQKLVLFDRNGVSHPLIPARDSSKAYVDSLKKLLRTLAQNSRTVLRDFSWKNRKSQIQGRTQDLNDKGDENNKHDLSLNQNNRRIINHVLNEPLKIYQADIEMAIGILLHIEIPKIKVIKEKALNALKMFLDVLIHLSPVSQVKTQLLRDLLSWLKNNDKLTGLDFIDLVNCYEKKHGRTFYTGDFVGCRGSQAYTRGFPCSLWHLFHFLTVEVTNSGHILLPGQVIQTISDFLRYFFSTCVLCIKHFEDMTKHQNIAKINHYDKEVLWLWKAHNEINKQLANGRLEDPRFPKIQFPSSENCPECQTDVNNWDTNAVLRYLKNIYSKKKLSLFGLNESEESIHTMTRSHTRKNVCTTGSLDEKFSRKIPFRQRFYNISKHG